MAVSELVVSIIGDMTELSKTFSAVQKDLDTVGTKISSVGKSLSSAGSSLSTGITAPILAAGVAIGAVTNQAVDFEKGMAQVYTLLPNASKESMDAMAEDVKNFSKEVGVTTDDVLPALYDAIGSGVPEENVFSFLEVAQKGAVAGATNIGVAVDTLTSVTNAYGIEALSAAEASDIMFAGINVGKMTYEQLQKSLYEVVPTAASLGVSFEEVTAALAAMTAQGTPTTVATAQLRQLFVELSKEGTVASDTFKELAGKSFYEFIQSGGTVEEAVKMLSDSLNNAVPDAEAMEKAMFDLADPTSGLALEFESLTGKTFEEFQKAGGTVEEALATLGLDFTDTKERVSDYFGSVEAGNAILNLSGQGAEIYAGTLAAVGDSAGETDKAFAKMSDTSAKSLSNIKAKLDVLAVTLGEKFLPVLEDTLVPLIEDTLVPALEIIIPIIGDIADGFNKLPKPVKLAVLGFIALIAALGPVLIVIGSVVSAVGTIALAFGAEGVFAGAITWVSATLLPALGTALGLLISPIGLIAVAVAALYLAWTKNWFGIRDKAQVVWDWLKSQGNALWQQLEFVYHAIIMSGATLKSQFVAVWDAIKNAFSTISGMIVSLATGLYTRLASTFNSIISAVTNLLNAWRTNWNNLTSATSAISATLQSLITSLYNKLKGIFNSIVLAVVSLLSSWRTQWNNIYTLTVTSATNIINKVKDIPTAIKKALSINLYSTGSGFITNLKNGVLDGLNSLYKSVVAQLDKIKSTITSAESSISTSISKLASSSASSMGTSLSNAITSSGAKAKVSLAEAASGLKRLLPNSPAKEGPFKELPNWDAVFVDPLRKSIETIKGFSNPLKNSLSSLRSPLDSMGGGLKNVSNVSTTSNSYGGDSLILENVNISNNMDLQAIFTQFESWAANKRRARGYYI